MAFALIGIGLLLFMTAYQNNVAALGAQLKSDVSGSSGFFVWVVALFIIGAIGYVPVLKGVSRIFLVLVLVVLFLANKGVFTQFVQAIGVTPSDSSGSSNGAPSAPSAPDAPAAPASGAGAGGGGGGGF